jgi:NAD+ synthase
MTDLLVIALAQINPVVGDLDGNVEKILATRVRAADMGADLVVFSELVVSGYPPEDLVMKPAFQESAERAVRTLAEATADSGPALLIGAPWRVDGRLYNAALLLDEGQVAASVLKHDLPNYGVFDEVRRFTPGPFPGPVSFRGVRLGVMVCEDMWTPDVAECLQETGAEILVVINGSPFETDKPGKRMNLATARVLETGLPLVYVNQVGGQDELVFDGSSFVLGREGSLRCRLVAWEEGLVATRWRREGDGWAVDTTDCKPPPRDLEAIYRALMRGLRDYVNKNYFPGVILGLSGGLDSALAAALAVDALGPDRVHCVMMPSPYTAASSIEDAKEVARLLGVKLDSIPIAPAMATFESMLREVFANRSPDTTEENIQARSRAVVLMALSNKFGYMLLSTGNKSEISVGYSTLYGDMCGGFSVLSDVFKTTIFALSRWRNENLPATARGPASVVIPEHVIAKPPSAELKPDQRDDDFLPPYEVLDAILVGLVEEEKGIDEIVASGFERETVEKVWHMVDVAEYKRRQAAPGVKITSRSFGRDRRYPITNAYRGRI